MGGRPYHNNLPDCRVDEDVLKKLNTRQDSVNNANHDISLYDGSAVNFKEETKECVACKEVRRTLQAPCEHQYCTTCVVRLVTDSTIDESLFPPHCCGREMPMSLIRPYITTELAAKFEQKAFEFGTSSRTYCYSCGKFITPDGIQGHRAHCTSCAMDTCLLCRRRSHEGRCPEDPALETVLQLAKQRGWQRCSHCHAMIERQYGCNHMT